MNERDELQLINEIDDLVREFVDEHPRTRRLPEVARRNMAYRASRSATDAVTSQEWAMASAEQTR